MTDDKEAAAIVKVIAAFADLDPETIGRVLRWANDRYGVSTTSKKSGLAQPKDGSERGDGGDTFEDVATLFHAAAPKTDAERVLVAGYWFQHDQGQKDLSGQTINSTLKHMGERVSNVTAAFRTLIEEKPALAMLVQKSGKTKQARKKYRLTTAGIKRVKEMLESRTD